jgi:hypothetical protein
MKWKRYGYNHLWPDYQKAIPLSYFGSWNLVNLRGQTVGLNHRPEFIFDLNKIDPKEKWDKLYWIKSKNELLASKSFFGDLLED